MLAMTSGAGWDFVGLRSRVVDRRVVAFDAALIQRFALGRVAADQSHEIDRVGSQRLKVLMTCQAVIVPARMYGRNRPRRGLLVTCAPADNEPAEINDRSAGGDNRQ